MEQQLETERALKCICAHTHSTTTRIHGNRTEVMIRNNYHTTHHVDYF